MALKSSYGKELGKPAPRKFTFTFTLKGLFGLFAVGMLALTWVFIFGLLLGRGYKPENAMPELARLMPSKHQAAPAAQPASPDQTGQAQDKPGQGQPTQTAQAAEHKEPTALKPEELGYLESLQGKPGAPTPPAQDAKSGQKPGQAPGQTPGQSAGQTAQAQKKDPAQQAKDAKDAQKKAAELAQAVEKKASEGKKTELPPQAPQPGQPAQQGKAADQGKPSDGQVFEYVYQAAAFDNLDAAKAFQAKLKAAGISSSMEETVLEGKSWRRVNVILQGTNESAQALKDKLSAAGVKNALLRSKKPL